MDRITATQFSKKVINTCSDSTIVKEYQATVEEDLIASIKITLKDNSFIQVYYNAEKEKVSYAWIKEEKRIYGADNLGHWHIHPLNNPEDHIASEEISFKEFLKNIEQQLQQ